MLTVAAERMSKFDPDKLIPEEQVWKRLDITQEDLDTVVEVEFE